MNPDGHGRWKGFVRDDAGPQASVVVTYDGLLLQMSKHYAAGRPSNYPEWVYYVGTIKHDRKSKDRVAVGTWSIPGEPSSFGFFTIDLHP